MVTLVLGFLEIFFFNRIATHISVGFLSDFCRITTYVTKNMASFVKREVPLNPPEKR